MAEATRMRLIAVTEQLMADGGQDAVSTRAVGRVAGVQAPTIYRIFGDKQGLLDAVATTSFGRYLDEDGALEPTDDPLDDLRRGWDLHVRFGLANPVIYSIIYGDPRPDRPRAAAIASTVALATHIRRVAEKGLLAVSEARAVDLMYVAGCGLVLTLNGIPEGRRDLSLSDAARESAIAAVTAPQSPRRVANAAVAAITMRARLVEVDVLTERERSLMEEWLDRISSVDLTDDGSSH